MERAVNEYVRGRGDALRSFKKFLQAAQAAGNPPGFKARMDPKTGKMVQVKDIESRKATLEERQLSDTVRELRQRRREIRTRVTLKALETR